MRRALKRRPLDLVLDAVFALWVVHLLFTGHVLPPALTALLRNETPIVAVTEPEPVPSQADETRPEADRAPSLTAGASL
jgi:hypothetical protein